MLVSTCLNNACRTDTVGHLCDDPLGEPFENTEVRGSILGALRGLLRYVRCTIGTGSGVQDILW